MTDRPQMVTLAGATGAAAGAGFGATAASDVGAVLYHRMIKGQWPEEIPASVQGMIGGIAIGAIGLVVALIYWRLSTKGFQKPDWSMFGKKRDQGE